MSLEINPQTDRVHNQDRGHDLEPDWKTEMNWLMLDSKMLASVAYDADKYVLYLRFRTGEVYRYFDFSGRDYQELLNAESRGKYFLAHIRDQFRYERMAKLRVA